MFYDTWTLFFVLGTETAFFSLQKLDKKRLLQSGSIGRRMLKLLNRRSALITTLIFGNQTVNVSLAATRAEFFVVEPHFVRESKPVDDLLHEMRGASMHMAVVVDEYGGLQALLQRKKSLVKSETSETTKGEHSFVLAPLNGGCLPKLNSKYC